MKFDCTISTFYIKIKKLKLEKLVVVEGGYELHNVANNVRVLFRKMFMLLNFFLIFSKDTYR